uniref:Uncharacterized protein n=1 Tax=Arundo donax TaxID=35708 RepID=A0A0A9C8P6_ARUDO
MPPPSLLLLQSRAPLPPRAFRMSSTPSALGRVVVRSAVSADGFISAAPILLPEGPWKQVEGGVTAAKGFKAAGIYGRLRTKGEKPDLALVACDVDATVAGAFTTNIVAAAPVLYCKRVLSTTKTARAVLVNAGQANAATVSAYKKSICSTCYLSVAALNCVWEPIGWTSKCCYCVSE